VTNVPATQNITFIAASARKSVVAVSRHAVIWPNRAIGHSECAVAERRNCVLGFGEVDAADIAFVEHHTLGSQSAQVVVTETMTDVFAFDPDCFGVVRAVSRAAV
jgi:hypothetical protein